MGVATGVLARGPWNPDQVEVAWRADPFEPSGDATDAADVALDALRARGSPSHDGFAARLVDFETAPDRLSLELQPARWALRLIPDGAARSLSVLCVVRDAADGRWLAGRRAAWLASWAGRWALGAGGSVEVDENPTETMGRELREEWSVEPERLRIEALVLLPSRRACCSSARRGWPTGATVTPDHEHDEFAWWPADVAVAGRGGRAAAAHRGVALQLMRADHLPMRLVTFGRLEVVSFIHSSVYLALLVCAFALGNPEPATFILGLAHGLIWIAMSLVCIAAARVRDHPVLARDDRRRARRSRAVCGHDRVRDREPPA